MNNFESKREVTGIVLFFCAIALILLYYLPGDVTGVLGNLLKTVGGGFIGSSAFMIPVFRFNRFLYREKKRRFTDPYKIGDHFPYLSVGVAFRYHDGFYLLQIA